jgi:hypothetical protein
MTHAEKPLVATSPEVEAVMEALGAPFEKTEVKFRPGVVSGNRALALHFVDARVIQDRLDAVMGVANWQDEYECLPDGSVVCRLRLRLGGEWITKMDVGGRSEQPDEGDRRKAAFSDALKRAAVKFGIGRYLYRVGQQWCDYDPQKRRFLREPTLPASALPRTATVKMPVATPPRDVKEPTAAPPHKDSAAALPANGAELQKRLHAYDESLAKKGVCRQGELVKHVVQSGIKAGLDGDLASWTGPAIRLAVEETRAFENRLRNPSKKEVA